MVTCQEEGVKVVDPLAFSSFACAPGGRVTRKQAHEDLLEAGELTCSFVVVRLNQLRKRYAHVPAQPALSPISRS